MRIRRLQFGFHCTNTCLDLHGARGIRIDHDYNALGRGIVGLEHNFLAVLDADAIRELDNNEVDGPVTYDNHGGVPRACSIGDGLASARDKGPEILQIR